LVVAMTASDAPVYLQKLSVPATEPSSPFFALAQHPHRLQRTLRGAAFGGAAAVLLTLLLLVGLWVGLPPWLDSYALGWLILPAALFWMTLTQQLWEVKRSVPHPVRNQRLVGKIRSLMEAAGYRVVIYPSTSDPDLAPLVALLDFMAVRPDRILAGQVRETIDWNPLSRELTSLQPAAAALEDELSKTRDVEVDVEAVLVVVGTRRPADWPRASGYRVIEAPVEAEIDALLSDLDVERKARRAMLLCDGAPRASAASVEAVSLESWPT
ncbi:MAG: hypothetical protein JWQ94_1529, partial [Tardiphaga sp.]|nr:hypothetical protein [Tardiphaga sp.]